MFLPSPPSDTPRPARLQRLTYTAFIIGLGLLIAAGPATAQLPVADPFQAAAGGSLPAVEQREGIPSNPSGLSAAAGWQVVLSPLRIGLGLAPISGADLARAGDGVVSRSTREAWLRRLAGRPQRGSADLALGPIAIRRGPLALDVATTLTGRARLPADAVELILFGNAGRTGEPRDFRLDGSRLDGTAFTAVGLAWGIPATDQLSLGARIHANIGHGVLLTRDAGSVLDGEDATAALRLPTISSVGAVPGFGMGLDVGVTWTHDESRTGVAVHNAVSSFGWRDADLRYREAETLIEGEGVSSDFEARPLSDAPPTLRALLRRRRPARRIEVEHVRTLGDRVHLRLMIRERLEAGIAPGTPDARQLGLEWQAQPWLALATHSGSVEGDLRLGFGARMARGSWGVSGAWMLDRGDDRRGSTLAISMNWTMR